MRCARERPIAGLAFFARFRGGAIRSLRRVRNASAAVYLPRRRSQSSGLSELSPVVNNGLFASAGEHFVPASSAAFPARAASDRRRRITPICGS